MSRSKKKPGIHFFSKLVLACNVFAVIALLISYLASYLDPGTFWPPSFFGLAYPGILTLNILFIFYWLIRYPRYALISLIAIAAGWSVLFNYVGFRESTAIMVPKSSESFIRVMTYNVHNFKQFGDKNDQFTKDQILDIIRKEQPDVICFQEFFTRKKGEYNFEKLISEILKTDNYYFKPDIDNGYEAIGMAIFSKLPIVKKGNVPFDDRMAGNEAIYIDVRTGKRTMRIYNVHFQSINFQPEDYQYIKKVKEIDTDVKSSKKIGSRLKRAFIKRGEQVEKLKNHTNDCGIPYVIAGDFNDTPISYTVKAMSKGLNNSFREKGSGFGVTYNGEFPNFQIDYILSSTEFSVKNYLIIDKKLSDHYPVRTDLEIK